MLVETTIIKVLAVIVFPVLLQSSTQVVFAEAAVAVAANAVQSLEINEIVVFGDSFSDTGKIYNASNSTIPDPTTGYYNGRYSNGRNYVDFLAEMLSSSDTNNNTNNIKVLNYAWGGATTNNHFMEGYSTFLQAPVPSVDDQIHDYISSNNSSTTTDSVTDRNSDNTQCIIVFGTSY
jgi:phospholipase/lecithinase/hemolysin